jgi:suppressor of ftsI
VVKRRLVEARRLAGVVATAGAAAGAALVVASGGEAQSQPPSTIPVIGPAPFTPHEPFSEPPVVRSEGGRLKATLIARNGTVEISGVQVANTQTYAAGGSGAPPRGFLGPTLQAQPGDTVELTLDNRLSTPANVNGSDSATARTAGRARARHAQAGTREEFTNLHFHGLHVTPRTRARGRRFVYGDNVLLTLPNGRSKYRFRIPRDHDRGTFWYHSHLHGYTDDQVYRGLAGVLLIGDSREYLPERFSDVRTRTLALKDIQVVENPAGSGRWAIPGPRGHDWVNPTHRTVNGLVNPDIAIRPGETQLWRVANTSSAVWYRIALVDEARGDARDPFTVVAQDGNPLVRAQRRTSALLGPGHRLDILVRGPESGNRILKTLRFDQGRPGAIFPEDVLATMEVSGAPVPALAPPGRQLSSLPKFPPRRGPTRSFVFSLTPPRFMINNRVFDPQFAAAKPRLGTTETWTIDNRSAEWHPIHIHQDDFRVISVNGRRVRPNGDQDVVALPPMNGDKPGRVVIRMPFQDYSGEFVIHCHILDHEDGGMMALIDARRARR